MSILIEIMTNLAFFIRYLLSELTITKKVYLKENIKQLLTAQIKYQKI